MSIPVDLSESIIENDNGIIFTIEVTTGSNSEKFPNGYNMWRKAFGILVKSLPIEGKANKAVVSVIAESLSVPKQSVTIISGLTSNIKKVRVTGISRHNMLTLCKKDNFT